MPLLGSSFLIGCQNIQPHCSGTSLVTRTGANPVSVVCSVICVSAQQRHIFQTACGRHHEFVASHHLRSADTTTLLVLPTRWVTLGNRAFPVAAAQAWNSLPAKIRAASSLLSFGGRQRSICLSCRTTDF